jgi:hypothetical protein
MNVLAPIVSALVLMIVPAQEPAKAKSEVVRFGVVVKVGGKAEPRLDAAGKDTGARRWTGRVLEWQVGTKTLADLREVEAELHRIASDPALRRKDPDDPQRDEPPPLELEPGVNARWRDVIEQWDAAQAAGFWDVRLRGVPTKALMVHGLATPDAHGGALRLAPAVFNMPDDDAEPERHVFDVLQDGRIVHDGREVGRGDDLAALDAVLRQVREALTKAGRVEKRHAGGVPPIRTPVMVRVDEECEWRDVQRLLLRLVAPEVGYANLQLAAVDKLKLLPREGASEAGKGAKGGK